jgi:hypothetical protein
VTFVYWHGGEAYLLEIGEQLLGGPSLGLPVIEVNCLSATVGEEVDGGTATEDSARRHNQTTTVYARLLVALVEERVNVARQDVVEEQKRVRDVLAALVVLATLDDEDGQVRERVAQPRGDNAAGGTTCSEVRSVNAPCPRVGRI